MICAFILSIILCSGATASGLLDWYSLPDSPKSISGLTLWLDATDNATIILSNNYITSWADKSMTGCSFDQTTVADRPLLVQSGVHGVQSIFFSTNYLYTTGVGLSIFAGLDRVYCFLVFRPVGTTRGTMMEANTAQSNTRLGFFHSRIGAGYIEVGGRRIYSDSYSYLATAVTHSNGNHLLYMQVIYTNATAELRVDGALIGASTSWGTAGVSGPPSSQIAIGSESTLYKRNPFIGYIGEILVYTNELSAPQKKRIENYLGRKWGISISQ